MIGAIFRALPLLLLSLWLGSCKGGVLPSRGQTYADSAAAPRIVVQLGHHATVQAVRWINGGSNLVSFALDGSIVVWDVANSAILDTAQIPIRFRLDESGLDPRLRAVDLTADGGAMRIVFWRSFGADKRDGSDCPADARTSDGAYCGFLLDLQTRKIAPDPRPFDAGKDPAMMPQNERFPLSPDGRYAPIPEEISETPKRIGNMIGQPENPVESCLSVFECDYGIRLLPKKGGYPILLLPTQRGFLQDVDVSADGQKLVRLNTDNGMGTAFVSVMDMSSGSVAGAMQLGDAYHRVTWLGDDRYLLQSGGYNTSNILMDRDFPPTLVVDAACMARPQTCRKLPPYTFTHQVSADGGFIGFGDAQGCFAAASVDDVMCPAGFGSLSSSSLSKAEPERLSWFGPGASAWRPMQWTDWGGGVPTAVAVSSDRTKVAVATSYREDNGSLQDRQILRVLLFGSVRGGELEGPPVEIARIADPIVNTMGRSDGHGGVVFDPDLGPIERDSLAFDASQTIRSLAFTPDGSRIVFAQSIFGDGDATLRIVGTEVGKPGVEVRGTSFSVVPAGPSLLLDLGKREVIDSASGKRLATLDSMAPFSRGGYIPRSNLLWVATANGSVDFYDAAAFTRVLTLHLLADGGFFAVAPDGRYDTNLPPDTKAVRWLVPDAPFQSLEPQTFMRDYYEPGLYARLLACRAAGNCAQAFKPLPSLAQVNRVLPTVSFVSAVPANDGHAVTVTVDVAEGRDDTAANGKTRSGIYNPRLFMNGQLVAMVGSPADVPDDTIAAWRMANGVGGKRRFVWTVPVAANGGGVRLEFDAYAFNEDRIKSETVHGGLTIVSRTARPRRAYVIAIGIDDYTEARFRLHYAAADAQAMGERLSHIPDREVRTLVLGGTALAGGRRSVVSRMTIANALGLLDRRRNRSALLAALRRDGFDGSAIEPATPDDLVIVSYSGHGWADVTGNFHLVPSDGGWPTGGSPDVRRLFSSADFVRAILPIEAGRMALIIDACHSSASVANGRFKPGPMGDSGLGQLAWDKNLLVLAATQADDVAREDARLGQGLLTYALAREGLAPGNPRADSNADGEVSLDEWLGYAMVRLPELSSRRSNTMAVGGPRGLQFSDGPAGPPPVRVQQPSLFDFHKVGAGVYLMRNGR
ncbi:MAG: hypothetical protein ACK4Z8_04090 [Novosphingobium sp.]